MQLKSQARILMISVDLKRLITYAFALFIFATGFATFASAQNATLIDSFSNAEKNESGGRRGVFKSKASKASLELTKQRGSECLKISGLQKNGFAGVYVQGSDINENQYRDVTRFKFLSFFVRSNLKGGDLSIRVADKAWHEKDDSIELSTTSELLSEALGNKWRAINIPLGDKIDWSQFAQISFHFTASELQTFFVDEIQFRATELQVEELDTASKSSVVMKGSKNTAFKGPKRSLWVWSTKTVLENSLERRKLFRFCQQQHVGAIWLQILYDADRKKAAGKRVTIRHQTAFKRLIREAHQANVKVHALDGYPDYALSENHWICLELIRAILKFNQIANEDAIFDGVHFDNEPYSIIGWQVPEIRKQIIRDFLELNRDCQALCDLDRRLEYGIDIPSWWHSTDPKNSLSDIEFGKSNRSLAMHCVSMLDQVGIMNYRDQFTGVDSMQSIGEPILKAAPKKARVIMGVETFEVPPTRVWFALGMKRDEFEELAKKKGNELAWVSRYNNYRLRTFDDGKHVHVGVEFPNDQWYDQPEFQKTLRKIVQTFGNEGRTLDEINSIRSHALKVLSKNPEFTKSREIDLKIEGLEQKHPGLYAFSIMLPKITFADDGPEKFATEILKAERGFSNSKPFGGMAIHAYQSAAKLLSGKE